MLTGASWRRLLLVASRRQLLRSRAVQGQRQSAPCFCNANGSSSASNSFSTFSHAASLASSRRRAVVSYMDLTNQCPLIAPHHGATSAFVPCCGQFRSVSKAKKFINVHVEIVRKNKSLEQVFEMLVEGRETKGMGSVAFRQAVDAFYFHCVQSFASLSPEFLARAIEFYDQQLALFLQQADAHLEERSTSHERPPVFFNEPTTASMIKLHLAQDNTARAWELAQLLQQKLVPQVNGRVGRVHFRSFVPLMHVSIEQNDFEAALVAWQKISTFNMEWNQTMEDTLVALLDLGVQHFANQVPGDHESPQKQQRNAFSTLRQLVGELSLAVRGEISEANAKRLEQTFRRSGFDVEWVFRDREMIPNCPKCTKSLEKMELSRSRRNMLLKIIETTSVRLHDPDSKLPTSEQVNDALKSSNALGLGSCSSLEEAVAALDEDRGEGEAPVAVEASAEATGDGGDSEEPTQTIGRFLAHFRGWLAKRHSQKPVDKLHYVLDGPNLAYINQNFAHGDFRVDQIQAVVSHLEAQGHLVTITMPAHYLYSSSKSTVRIRTSLFRKRGKQGEVLYRERLEEDIETIRQWRKKGMIYVCPTDRLSDDLIWVYASLVLGSDARIVTNDLGRDHVFRFTSKLESEFDLHGSHRLESVINTWQKQSFVGVKMTHRPWKNPKVDPKDTTVFRPAIQRLRLLEPLPFSRVPQMALYPFDAGHDHWIHGMFWHIPVSKHQWLCVHKAPPRTSSG